MMGFLKIVNTNSQDTLAIVHVKNNFEDNSFWNYCNGEVLAFVHSA